MTSTFKEYLFGYVHINYLDISPLDHADVVVEKRLTDVDAQYGEPFFKIMHSSLVFIILQL